MRTLAVIVLGLAVGFFGSMAAEAGDHQQRHIDKIESRF